MVVGGKRPEHGKARGKFRMLKLEGEGAEVVKQTITILTLYSMHSATQGANRRARPTLDITKQPGKEAN
jgi:hypothetical protein